MQKRERETNVLFRRTRIGIVEIDEKATIAIGSSSESNEQSILELARVEVRLERRACDHQLIDAGPLVLVAIGSSTVDTRIDVALWGGMKIGRSAQIHERQDRRMRDV